MSIIHKDFRPPNKKTSTEATSSCDEASAFMDCEYANPDMQQDYEISDFDASTNKSNAEFMAGCLEPLTDWVEPANLYGDTAPAPFPVDLLPKVISRYIVEQSSRMGVDQGLLGMSCLGVAFAACDDRIKLQVKRNDPLYQVSANAFIASVGDASIKKTPALNAATFPVHLQNNLWQKQFAGRISNYKLECQAHTKAYKKEAEKKLLGKDSKLIVAPIMPEVHRTHVSDITVEKLGDILQYTDRGVLVLHDELSGFFASIDRHNNGDSSSWLTFYNGQPHQVERIGRGQTVVNNWGGTILGNIQPEPIRKIAASLTDNGLLPRFNITIAEPATKGHDEPVNPQIKDDYEALILQMYSIGTKSSPIQFSIEAAKVWQRMQDFTQRIMKCDYHPSGFIIHLGKWEGMFGRYCLLFHIMEHAEAKTFPSDEISLDVAERVETFFKKYLFTHALSFYTQHLDSNPLMVHARWIGDFILSRNLGTIDRRTIRRAYRTLKDASEDNLTEIMTILIHFDWVRQVKPNRWEVNPQIHDLWAKRAIAEKNRRADIKKTIKELAELRKHD